MKKFTITIFLIGFSTSLFAQDYKVPNWRIGITPSTLIHWFPSVNISMDKSVLSSSNVSFDGGYIFGNDYSATGFRTRLGIEKIIPAGSKAGYYFGGYFHGRYTSRLTQAARFATSGEYVEFSEYFTRSSTKLGISGSAGSILQLTTRIHLEIGIGLGLHKIVTRNSIELAEDMLIQDEWFTDFDTLGFMYTHISFTYQLNKQ